MPAATDHLPRPAIDACARLCADCALVCKEAFFIHGVQLGGEHIHPLQVQLLMDCSAACAIAADFLIRRSARHVATCRLCAEVCRLCAEECRTMGGMGACAALCEQCAESCSQLVSAP